MAEAALQLRAEVRHYRHCARMITSAGEKVAVTSPPDRPTALAKQMTLRL